MAWVILALGLAWLALRAWQNKQAEARAEARDLRMAELLAEREKMANEPPPSSIAAVVSDSREPVEEPKEKRCLGCRTVNPASSTTCAGCGLEL